MKRLPYKIFLLLIIWPVLIIFSTVLYGLSHLPKSFSGRYYHSLTRRWCKLFVFALDVDLNLLRHNTQPLPEHYILIANHPSALEDFAVPALFDIYPLAKVEVKKWFILGSISEYAGTIYVERENPRSRHAVLQALVDAVKAGKNLVIFPEGGCKGRRIYKNFQTGAFEISLRTGIPVLPAYLQYIDEDTFEWKTESLVKKLWQIFINDNNRVNYHVHDAIYPDGFDNKDSFARYAHSRYLQWQQEYLDTDTTE